MSAAAILTTPLQLADRRDDWNELAAANNI
jgi:hypothetical protein